MPAGSTVLDGRADGVRGRLAVGAVLTFAAGVVHVAAAVPHFGDDTLLGSAFTITGWAQIVAAALLLRRRPARFAVWIGVGIHVAALGALVVARTIGLPVGHGGVEPVTLPDATTALLEATALVVLAGWLRRPHRIDAPQPLVVGALGAAGLVALGGSTVAVASLGTAGHGHGEASADTAHVADAPHGHGGAAAAGSHEADTAGDARVHVHDDESIHVHAPGEGHEHDDGTIHVHAGAVTPEPTEQPTESDAHTHGPGEGHG